MVKRVWEAQPGELGQQRVDYPFAGDGVGLYLRQRRRPVIGGVVLVAVVAFLMGVVIGHLIW
jgi:hypothetical protein